MSTKRHIIGLLALLLGGALAIAGWGAGQALLGEEQESVDATTFTRLGETDEGTIILQSEEGGVFMAQEIPEKGVVVNRELVGTTAAGDLVVEEHTLRVIPKGAQAGVTEVTGPTVEEPGAGEFEQGDEEPPVSEMVPP